MQWISDEVPFPVLQTFQQNLNLEKIPVPAMVFDPQDLSLISVNRLWRHTLGFTTVPSHLYEIDAFISGRPLETTLSKNKGVVHLEIPVEIAPPNRLKFKATLSLRSLPGLKDRLLGLIYPDAQQDETAFLEQIAENQKDQATISQSPEIAWGNTHISLWEMVVLIRHFWGKTPARFFLLSPEGQFLTATPAYLKAHHYQDSILTGKKLEDLYEDDIANTLTRNYQEVIETQAYRSQTFTLEAGAHYIDIFMLPFWDTDGNVTAVIGVERERTDFRRSAMNDSPPLISLFPHEKMEGEWSEAESSFFFLLDEQDRLAFYNAGFLHLTGGRMDVEAPLAAFFDEKSAEKWQVANEKLLKSGGARTDRVGWKRNGEVEQLLIHRTSFLKADGHIGGILVSGTNLTIKQQVEGQWQAANELLSARLAFLQQTIDAVPSLMLFVDNKKVIRNCNQAFADLFSMTPDDIEGRKIEELPDVLFDQAFRKDLEDLIRSSGTFQKEYGLQLGEENKTFLVTMASMYDQPEKVRGVVIIGTDITEYKRLETALVASEDRLQLAFEATEDGFWDWNAETDEFYISPRLADIIHLQTMRPYHHFMELWGRFHPENEAEKQEELALIMGKVEGSEFEHEFQYLCGDEKYRWLRNRILVVRDKTGEIKRIVASVTDIDESKRAQAEIAYLANHDPLTRLPNRILLTDRIQQELALARRDHLQCALVFIDLDHFKTINDTLGHAVGDELLKEMANRLSRSIREVDTVARISGDEFVMLLCRLKKLDEVDLILKRVLQETQEPFILAGESHHVFCSLGVAVYPEDGEDVNTLMKRADEAMYVAKRAGRNQYVFWSHQDLYSQLPLDE